MPTLAAIRAERLARRNRPSSPAELATRASGGRWKTARHLRLLDDKLRALAEGRIRRLIVTMPPRHGKSELCSKYFPAWFLGTFPDRRVILCSYEADFAAEWGEKARDILEEHGESLFGVTVQPDHRARHNWRVSGYDGAMMTAGVGGPITGKGAHVLIIDDPVKNAEEANSPTYREKAWQWWLSTALTRVEPEGSVLLIQTRWHEDDLAGRLIAERDRADAGEGEETDEPWEVLNLPAIAEEDDAMGRTPGEALWPERWPLSRILARMRHVGTVIANALFQQRPSAPEGNYFKRAWFRIVEPDRVPTLTRVVRCWDLAATIAGENGNTDPDWLVGAKLGQGEDGKFYMLHVHRERTTPDGVEKTIKQYGQIDGRDVAVRIEQEGAASGKLTAFHFERMMTGWDCRFTGIPRGNKGVRASGFNAACERGDVLLVQGAWNGPWIDEVTAFPNATHDDQVDAPVGAFNFLTGGAQPWDGDALRKKFANFGKWRDGGDPHAATRRASIWT